MKIVCTPGVTEIQVNWICGYNDIDGNELVDQIAKEASAGASSAAHQLPAMLQQRLSPSSSTLKQEFKAKTKAKWAQIWKTSP